MSDYKKMYHKLFNATTNAITILQEAQKDAEEIYLNSESTILELLSSNNKNEDSQ